MIRYYCDSNIYRYIKSTSINYNEKLHQLMESLKDKVLFCFSSAHIEDLKGSKIEYHGEDIAIMERYVKDNYFEWSFTEKKFHFYLGTPTMIYDKYNLTEDKRNQQQTLDQIFSENISEELSPFLKVLEPILDIPIGLFSIHNLDNDKWLLEKFPKGKNTTVREIMDASMKMLWNEKEFKEYKKLIESYFNNDDYSFDKWQMEFNERFKSSPLQMTFLDYIELSLNNSQKNDSYLRFNNIYCFLETLNITTEKVGNKRKANSFGSLSIDAQHAFFGAHADYLISEDSGLRMKARIIYSLFNIPTKVLSIDEFIKLNETSIEENTSTSKFLEDFQNDMSSFTLDKSFFSNGGFCETIKTKSIYFNYFNSLQLQYKDGINVFGLFLDRKDGLNNLMYREVQIVVSKLLFIFGIDDDNLGEYDIKESVGFDKHVRRWTLGNLSLALFVFNSYLNNVHLTLTISFNNVT